MQQLRALGICEFGYPGVPKSLFDLAYWAHAVSADVLDADILGPASNHGPIHRSVIPGD
jgi:hypothetical protein